MMNNYRPWNYQQLIMDENPYYRYMMNNLQPYYTSPSEQQEEDYDQALEELPSESSSDQNPHTDTFRLAFEAAQWSKLVLNAEGLFNQLISTYAPNEQCILKSQIEQWLCLKQEYEECITADDSGSLQGFTENTKRSLERIEEVTETDEKTDESDNWVQIKSRRKSYCSESEAFDDEDQSDVDSDNSEFLDKLEEYKSKLEHQTDQIVGSRKNNFSKLKDISPEPNKLSNAFLKSTSTLKSSRRKSILPNSDLSNEIIEFQKKINLLNLQQIVHDNVKSNAENELNGKNYSEEKLDTSLEDNFKKAIVKVPSDSQISSDLEHNELLRTLIIEDDDKQSQIYKISHDLNFAQKQVQELEKMIKFKEKSIQDMVKNYNARKSARQKFLKKRAELKQKYNNIQKAFEDTKDEKYNNYLQSYKKKIDDNDSAIELVSISKNTIDYHKQLLISIKGELDSLKKLIVEKKEQKKSLEDESTVIQNRIKDLKQNNSSTTSSKLKNYIFKNKNSMNSHKKIKSTDKNEVSEKTENTDAKDAYRQEIYLLRQMKDELNDLKCKHTRDKNSNVEKDQRKYLIMSENVETIDAVIEQKNVMICEKACVNENELNTVNEMEMPVMDRVKKLSHEELINLFHKYFYKVIDLKDSSKTLEIQNAMLEENIKKVILENKVKKIIMYHTYQKYINHLVNYYEENHSHENHRLKQRLAYFESIMKVPERNPDVRALKLPKMERSDVRQRQLAIGAKVTQEGNKLVFHAKR